MKIARYIFTVQKATGTTPEIEAIAAHFSVDGVTCTGQVVRNAIAYLQKKGTITRSKIRWTFKDGFDETIKGS